MNDSNETNPLQLEKLASALLKECGTPQSIKKNGIRVLNVAEVDRSDGKTFKIDISKFNTNRSSAIKALETFEAALMMAGAVDLKHTIAACGEDNTEDKISFSFTLGDEVASLQTLLREAAQYTTRARIAVAALHEAPNGDWKKIAEDIGGAMSFVGRIAEQRSQEKGDNFFLSA